jgi:(R,R)-butanediol dehydrogenase/meso-butanediol dehydrogenase/diacetyl reductase
VRWHGARDIRVEDVDDPGPPPPGWVRLAVKACGICGTDLEEYVHGPVVLPRSPIVLGHEAAGVVDAVGDGVSTLRVGQLVAVEGNITCGECDSCRRGERNLCRRNVQLGLHDDGGLAAYLLAPAAICAAVADGVAVEHAAMAEPVSVAVRAVARAAVVAGESVAVVGAGTVGLLLLQVAALAGAEVTVVEPHAARRALAVALGAVAAVPPDPGAGAGAAGAYDVVFESAGTADAARAAVALTRPGGRTVLLGVITGDVCLPGLDLLLAEKTVMTSMSHVFDPDFTTAVELISSGRLRLDPLITDRIALEDVVTRGFEELLAHPAEHLKVMVLP